ncbi:hypothetical protein NP233_g11547 [Leucocoprinus birnbaumii]|uniref:Uncharacterized protein n=1 Tax=Leucocoprinus birnbaumii TaxID=56174 RepID=A0AAD5YNV3_9AGAR|nr:hypothetical protein NP233_g11547 [Leucocoprinus birnbaumii]
MVRMTTKNAKMKVRKKQTKPASTGNVKKQALAISGPLSLVTEESGLTARHFYFDIRYDYASPPDSYSVYDASGFLELLIDASEYFHVDYEPRLPELTPFMDCISIPHASKLSALRLAENRKLTNGDQVLIAPTSLTMDFNVHIGRTGIIDDISNTAAYVKSFSRYPEHSDVPETVHVPLSLIRCHYRIGDYVPITICDPDNPENQYDTYMSLTEFSEVELHLGRNQGRSVAYLEKFELSIYENLPVTVLVGPLKGRSGGVKTISSRQKATAELRGSHAVQKRLEELSIRDLAFELEVLNSSTDVERLIIENSDLRSWYRQDVKEIQPNKSRLAIHLEAVHGIPVACSMITMDLAVIGQGRVPSNPPLFLPPCSASMLFMKDRLKRPHDGVNKLYDSTRPSKAPKLNHSQSMPTKDLLKEENPASVPKEYETTPELPEIETKGKKRNRPLYSACIVSAHLNQPTHHIERWNDGFFLKYSLHELGHVNYLRHSGKSCPCNTGKPNLFTAIHANDIHVQPRHCHAHGLDRVLSGRRPRCLALRCFACPGVGFNLDERVLELTRSEKMYALFVSADGNFRLQRKRKNNDPNDKALNKGNDYFVDDTKFHECLTGSKGNNVCDPGYHSFAE